MEVRERAEADKKPLEFMAGLLKEKLGLAATPTLDRDTESIRSEMSLLHRERGDTEEGEGNGENTQGSERTDSHLPGLHPGSEQ